MPRRFALALLGLLVLLLVALLLGRRLRPAFGGAARAVPTVRPTPVIPPTPIAARRVGLWFESPADEKLHPEARDLPSSSDDIAFVRALASAVLEGPRRSDLLPPFPEGWRLGSAYRLQEGMVVLDLVPRPVPGGKEGGGGAGLGPKWQTGSHEEETAAQALVVTLAKNLPDVTRVVLLVGGEPAETLAGHLDLSHPLRPDMARAVDEPYLPPPAPTAVQTPIPSPTPSPAPTRRPARRPAADLT